MGELVRDPPGWSPRCDARCCTHVTCMWERGEDEMDLTRAKAKEREAKAAIARGKRK